MRLARFREFWPGAAFALVLATMPVTSQAADTYVTHVVVNSWQSSDFHDPANPGCSIGGTGSMQGSRIIMGASQRRPTPMSLVIRKTGWAIPAGTQVQVRVAFPDGSTIDFAGRGSGQAVEIGLDAGQLRAWVHSLTANPNMHLMFAGNEPPWQFDLTGTSRVVNAMDKCFVAHHIEGVDPPFLGVASANGDAGRMASATQPFGGTLAGVPSPFPAPSAPGSASAPTTSYREPPTAAPIQPSQEVSHEPPPSAATSQKPSTVAVPPAGTGPCKDDWRGCRDNEDLVNKYNGYSDVQYRCKEEANRKARFGTPVWPGFWDGGAFTRFHKGTDYVSTGIVVAVEPDAQFQNGFGAMVHSTALCRYDLNAKAVISVEVVPHT
jgi:hypothetical protein